MKKRLLFLLVISSSLVACNKEISSEFNSYANNPLNDTIWAAATQNTMPVGELINELMPAAIKETVDGATGKFLSFGDTMSITVPANAFTTGSIPLTTPVAVEAQLFFKKGQFIRSGRTSAENNKIIIPITIMQLAAWNNTTAATVVPSRFLAFTLTTDTSNSKNYFVFTGKNSTSNDDASFNWTRQNINIMTWSAIGSGGFNKTGFQFNSNALGWSTVAQYMDSTLPSIRLNISLPLNYTNKNTAVFAAFKNNNAVIRLQADVTTKTFTFNRIPINSELLLVSISKIGNDYYIGTREITARSADLQNITPAKISLNDMKAYLDKL